MEDKTKLMKRIEENMKGFPEEWIKAIQDLYFCYPEECLPQGLCDYGYIANRLSHSLGLSNGRMG